MEQILIIEDDKGLNEGLCRALRSEGRQLVSCFDLKSARQQLLCADTGLVLLDINLPDGSGLDFLREIKRERPALPVILLTANDTDMDVVNGLELGADDYITKPFSLAVLRARVNTQLRRGMQDKAASHCVEIDGYRFDFERMEFWAEGEPVVLSKTEQKLLRLLVENRGSVMPRSVLLDRIWTDGAEYVDENALSVTMKRLRDKLSAKDYIRTVYGVGYSWVKEHE